MKPINDYNGSQYAEQTIKSEPSLRYSVSHRFLKSVWHSVLSDEKRNGLYRFREYVVYRIKSFLDCFLYFEALFFLKGKTIEKCQRSKKHILLVTDCFVIQGSFSDPAYELWGKTLEDFSDVTFSRICINKRYRRQSLFLLLNACLQEKPDYIFYSFSPETFCVSYAWKIIREKFDIPTIALLTDSDSVKIHINDCRKGLLGLISIDVPYEYCDSSADWKGRTLFLYSPFTRRVFFPSNAPRSKALSFIGQTNTYPERRVAIQKIQDAGYTIFFAGGYKKRIPQMEMADIYRDSLMVINFAEPNFKNILQCKGRVMEATLCGAALVERNNPATNHWLRPNVDYIAYDSIDEIPDKVKYYLEHLEELETIRRSGMCRAQDIFDSNKFWKSAMDFADRLSAENKSNTEKTK